MYCENCDYDTATASRWFYNDYSIDLLVSFVNKLDNHIVQYISTYLMYQSHRIYMTDKMYNGKYDRLLCAGCFQKGLYKYRYSGQTLDIKYFYNYIHKDDRQILLNIYKKYFLPIHYYLHHKRSITLIDGFTYL